jgi:Ca-activated chloride channel family protein
VQRSNKSQARVYVFGVGDDVNTDLLDRLARDNRGTREYVRPYEDLELKISNLVTKITTPVLADVKLSFRGVTVSEVYPRVIPDVFRGTQLAVVGRYEGSGRARVVLEGSTGERRRSFEYAVPFDHDAGHGFVGRLWAVRKVAFLLEEIRLHGPDQELIAEVERLGKRYGILTPYTSFLIVDESELAQAPPEVRRQLYGAVGGLKQSFERKKEGRAAVDAASAVAQSAGAAAAPAASADQALGSMVGRELAEQLGGENDAWAGRVIRREAVVHAGDKVFYSRSDGALYDSTYREGMRVEVVSVASERYFALLQEQPGIGRYLALNRDLVVVLGNKAYRIEGHDAQ